MPAGTPPLPAGGAMPPARRRARRRVLWALSILALLGAGATIAVLLLVPAGRTTALVLRISPNNGAAAGGTTVRIYGTGFTRSARVDFGARPARSVRVLSRRTIVAVSPAGAGSVQARVLESGGPSAATPYGRFAYDPPPSGPWLGLNGNSVGYLGPVDRFQRDHVAFDRDELGAGEVPSTHGRIARAIAQGMIPDVVIEYGGYTGNDWGHLDPRFPRGKAILSYVHGFVRTATAIRRMFPGRRILFEPINEPYGYATAAQYAAVIARLLPAAARAGIPPQDIYVAARGERWIPKMYAARPQLRNLIQGWYFHPYGPPAGVAQEDSAGIQSVPVVQSQMTSGQNNIIISEIGWCALTVDHGEECTGPNAPSGTAAAVRLAAALANALPMRRAGWLRGLLVYSRTDGGWAMQLPNGVLTEQGRALVRFARAHPER